MLDMRKKDKLERWGVGGLALVAVGLYAASYFFAYWKFTLLAPQYPDGLTINIFLSHLTGDVHEINELNHYIGMRSLTQAAIWERHEAVWAVGLLGVSVAGLTLVPGRKYSWLSVVPGVLFPLGFLGDSFYWLYTFGNHLDPRAPINIPPFTPTLMGEGHVGQFSTFAAPSVGFYLALTAVAAVAGAWLLRRRVCARCPLHDYCGKVCPNATVTQPSTDAIAKHGAHAAGAE